MSEPLSLTVIDHAKDRVHAFVADRRKRPKSCHHSDVRIEVSEAKGGYAHNGAATSPRGFGLYTDPTNRLGPGDFTGTIVGGSYRIEDGQIAQRLKPNAARIHGHFIHLFQHIIGASRDEKPTRVWSTEEAVVAPGLAVRRVHVENIAGYMG